MTDAPEPDAGPPPALEAQGIVKRFPGTLANDHVDFDLRRGEANDTGRPSMRISPASGR